MQRKGSPSCWKAGLLELERAGSVSGCEEQGGEPVSRRVGGTHPSRICKTVSCTRSASPSTPSPIPPGLFPGTEYLWNGFYFYTFLYYVSWDVFIISAWSSVVFSQTWALTNLYLFSFNKLSLFLFKFALLFFLNFAFLLMDFPTNFFGGRVMSAHLSLIKAHPLKTCVTSGNWLRVYQSQFSHLQSGANNNNNNTYLI